MGQSSVVESNILDRFPPSDLEAETAVLGSIFLLPDVCDDVAIILRPSDFYDDANRKLYEHLHAMHESGGKIDITLLAGRLKQAGDYEPIGGSPYLAKVIDSVPNAAHAVYYAKIVRQKAIVRDVISAATTILREAYDSDSDTAKGLLGFAERTILAVHDGREFTAARGIRDILHEAMDSIDDRSRGSRAAGMPTGFVDVDEKLKGGGLRSGHLIILAGRPGMGKSALALNVASAVAKHSPVIYFSLEMSDLELVERLLCGTAEVNAYRAANGTMSTDERTRLVETAGMLSQEKLYIKDDSGITISQIAAMCRRQKRKFGLGLVVIDYLQLITPEARERNREREVAEMSRALKNMARNLEVPVLCLAQLNREADDKAPPKLKHLRESGAIEQDADVVMFIHRPEYVERTDENAGKAMLVVAKQRGGEVCTIDLIWRKEFTRFETVAAEYMANYNDDFAEYSGSTF